MRCGRDAESNRSGARLCGRSHQITEPLRPATIVSEAGPPGVEPGPARLELAVLPFTPQAFESGRPGSNGPPRSGAPVLFRLSYVRLRYARLESNQRPLPSQGRTLSAELGAREQEPPAGFEPTPRPYKGRVLAVDTTEAKVETVGVEPTSSSLQARRSSG